MKETGENHPYSVLGMKGAVWSLLDNAPSIFEFLILIGYIEIEIVLFGITIQNIQSSIIPCL